MFEKFKMKEGAVCPISALAGKTQFGEVTL